MGCYNDKKLVQEEEIKSCFKEGNKEEKTKSCFKEGNKDEETKSCFKEGNKEKHFNVIFKIGLNEEKEEIYKVYELSDKRMAVELENSLKIYSLKTFQLITEINHERIHNSIELKNKDIAITGYSTVYFYKLSGNNYINYLKLEEEEEKKIFEIYELKNENLILCIRRCLIIYARGKEEYKFLSKIELRETVGKILEIKNNIIFLFLHSRSGTFATADYSPYYLKLLNFENKEAINLDT